MKQKQTYSDIGKKIIVNCKTKRGDGNYCGCNVAKEYYPFTDRCPLDGKDHDAEKDNCGFFLNGKCMYSEFNLSMTGMCGHHGYIADEPVRISHNFVHRHSQDNIVELIINCGYDDFNPALTERVLKEIEVEELKESYEFSIHELDKFEKILGIMIKNIPLIKSICKDIYVCSKCGLNKDVGIYGDNLFCDECKESILADWWLIE
jgi:hypothetical protein